MAAYTHTPDIDQQTAAVRDEVLARTEIGVLSFIFVFAVFGNSCVLFALKYRREKTSKMSLFITHLSFADLMVAFFNILPQLAWEITLRFKGPDLLCRFIKFMQIAVIYASTYILVMTAIDRYIAICRPMQRLVWTRQRAHSMALMAWALGFILSVPQLAIFKLQPIQPNSTVYDCWATFSPSWTVKMYTTFFSVTIYILPFFILVLLYGRICFVVWKNLRSEQRKSAMNHYSLQMITYKFNGTGQISVIADQSGRRKCRCSSRLSHQEDSCEAKLKTIKLTFVVIIAYVICWSPFMITQLWWAFDDHAPANEPVFVVCLLLASLNSCCNPCIYMAFSSTLIRKIIYQCLPWAKPASGPRQNRCPKCLLQPQVHNNGQLHHDSHTQKKKDEEIRMRHAQDAGDRRKHPHTDEDATTRTSLTKTTQRLLQQDSLRSQPVMDKIIEDPTCTQEQPIVSRGKAVLWNYNSKSNACVTKRARFAALENNHSLPDHICRSTSASIEAKGTSV